MSRSNPITFHAFLRGEDHTEFTIEVEAKCACLARTEAEERYPEATILEVFDPTERAEEAYHRAQAIYDDPTLDDFDY